MTQHALLKPYAFLYETADSTSTIATTALWGESFTILSSGIHRSLVQLSTDQYQGFMGNDHLMPCELSPTHYVRTRATQIFKTPDIKSPCPVLVPFYAQFHVCGETGIFAEIITPNGTQGYVIANDLCPLDTPCFSDHVTAAETLFLHTPYLWGGRTFFGIDCSGMVQMAFFAIDVLIPRDSKPQYDYFPHDVTNSPRKRGDIVFWKGHVGMMVNETDFLHANAHHMRCVIEPLADVRQRSTIPILGVKRL